MSLTWKKHELNEKTHTESQVLSNSARKRGRGQSQNKGSTEEK